MTKCDDAACNITKAESLVDCSSPFCQRKFHLSCANLKGKRKGELNSIYFLCNVCLEFIRFSNSNVETKLTNLEERLSDLIKPLDTKLQNIEGELKKSIENLSNRMDVVEKFQHHQQTYNTDTRNKIETLQQTIFDQINELKTNISQFEAQIKCFDEKSELNQKSIIHKKQTSESASVIDKSVDLTKYRFRISCLDEEAGGSKFIERQNAERNKIKDIFEHIGLPSINIADFFRLGKYSPNQDRPRTMLVTLCSVWDCRLIFQSTHKLKSYNKKVYLSPQLTNTERETERKILTKRRELISDGVSRSDLKIKNLKLYKRGEEIAINET